MAPSGALPPRCPFLRVVQAKPGIQGMARCLRGSCRCVCLCLVTFDQFGVCSNEDTQQPPLFSDAENVRWDQASLACSLLFDVLAVKSVVVHSAGGAHTTTMAPMASTGVDVVVWQLATKGDGRFACTQLPHVGCLAYA